MRKVSLLILLVFCSNIFIWSQNEKNTSKEDGIKKNEIFISYAKEIGIDPITKRRYSFRTFSMAIDVYTSFSLILKYKK
jgi:hypothetical protein